MGALLVPGLMAVACGDGKDPPSTAQATAPAGSNLTAASLVPDLTSLGFTIGQSERDPAAQPGQDAHRALFQQTAAPNMGAKVEVSVLKDAAAATAQWTSISAALRSPPPDLFGGNSTQKDAVATNIGDQSKAYVTASPDKDGTMVWSDAYRFGRSVVIVQVLSRNEPEALKARVAIAEKIRDKAK